MCDPGATNAADPESHGRGELRRTGFTRVSGAAALGFAVLFLASNLIAVPAGPPG